MNLNDKFRICAIVDELTKADSGFFNSALARELINIVPVEQKKVSPFSFQFRNSSKGGSAEGYSPDLGNVSVSDESEEKFTSLWAAPITARAGDLKLMHIPGQINIRRMWEETYNDRSNLACALLYTVASKEPHSLYISQQTTFRIPFTNQGIGYIKFVPWKKASYDSALLM